jgi:ketosteroid isomerase-like protein
MKPVQVPITGDSLLDRKNEDVEQEIFNALHQFYKAFNTKDFEMMQKNWLNTDEIAMDNPLGGIKRGWDEIKEVYQRIFFGKALVYVEYYDYTINTFENGFCAVGRERGYVEVDGKKLKLAIRTSRIFKKVAGAYKQLHHHGSIEDPELLKKYQNFVK